MSAANLNTVSQANLKVSAGKYILTGMSISIASFFIAAVIVLTSSLQGSINASIGDILAKADTVVVSAQANDEDKGTEFNLNEGTLQKIQTDPSVENSWALFQAQGKFGPDKVKAVYSQAPTQKQAELFPFPIEGNLPSNDSEIMVSREFAKKNNLSTNSKVTSQNIAAAGTDRNTGETKEYTVTALFDSGFSGSSSNEMVFLGKDSYSKAALEALKNN